MKINVVNYISELLYQHNCVIIPGFGGFIGNYSSAQINPVFHTFYPPRKSLLFNIHLKQNDGLLASHISQAEHVTYEDALENIKLMQENWTRDLENGQELVIDKVGKIIKETNGTFQFEQNPFVNYLPDAFGLATLVSPAIRRKGIQDKLDTYIHTSTGKSRKLTQSLKWAAVMALPIGLAVFLSLTNIDQIRNFQENYGSFLFPNSKPALKNKSGNVKIILPTKSERNSQSNNPVNSTTIPVVQPINTEIVDKVGIDVQKPYAVIVGAFRFHENADILIAKLNQDGLHAAIYDITKTGLFRVCVGTFDDKDQALRQLGELRSQKTCSAWLLSK